MKFLKLATAIMLVLTTLLSFAACTSNSEKAPTTEESTAPQDPSHFSINIKEGETLPDIPEGTKFSEVVKMKPSKEGFAFAGWYSDEALTDYIIPDHITDKQYQKATLYPKWIKVDPVTFDVRKDEATIRDTGRIHQVMDTVYLSQSLNVTDLTRAGYTKIKVDISLEVKEVNDGYQYIFFYSDTNCAAPENDDSLADKLFGDHLDEILGSNDGSDPSLIWTKQFEHGAKKDTAWSVHTFTTYIELGSLNDNLYVRYGASGNDDDDWINRNVTVTVTPQN